MTIRLATVADLAAIKRCASSAYSKYIERIGREPAPMLADFALQIDRQQVSVLTAAEELVAYAVSYPLDDCYFLENIAVDPAHQGCGYGAKMLAHVHQLAAGYAVIRLYTNEKMHENLGWYSHQGYVETERRHEDGFARVYMEKTLNLD